MCETFVGTPPAAPPALSDSELLEDSHKEDGTRRRVIRLSFNTPNNSKFDIELLTPQGNGIFPVFLFAGPYGWWHEVALERGYLVCIYPGADNNDATDVFLEAYPECTWSRLLRRAWLGSRALDYVLTLPDVIPDQVCMTGHSRNGKQSLIATAIAVLIGTLMILPGKSPNPETVPAAAEHPATENAEEPHSTPDEPPDEIETEEGTEAAADTDMDDFLDEILDEMPAADTEEENTTALAEPQPVVLTPDALFEKASPAVVRVEVRDREGEIIGLGSGFFVSPDGLVVTNHHVIDGASYATIHTADESKYFVEGIAASDADADLALLKVSGNRFSFLNLSESGLPKVGTKIYAIGNPQGLTNTLSEGIVSGHRAESPTLTLLQITAPISPGSSGGPLLTQDASVAGVTTAYLAEGQNLNFCIPAANVIKLIASRGELQKLSSAGGERLDAEDAEKVDQAWEAYRQKKYAAALRLLTEVRQTQGESEWYWCVLGFVHWGLDNTDMAIAAFRQAAKRAPTDPDYPTNIGMIYHFRGIHYSALAEFRAAINLDPSYAPAYRYLGDTYYALNRTSEAFGAYKTAVQLDPDDAQSWLGLAVVSPNETAVPSYKRAIELMQKQPDTEVQIARAYMHLAECYSELGKTTDARLTGNEAIRRWTKAVEMYPREAEYHFNLAVCRMKMGNGYEAIRSFKRVIQIDEGSWLAQSAAQWIEYLRGRGYR